MAINTQVLLEMEIPDNYVESLPKNGRSSLGDTIYKSITDERFDPEKFLSTIDLSLDHKILDLKNRIEASIVIWTRKMMMNKDAKSSWSSIVSLEKRELFEDRAKTLLLILKHRYPGVSQSELDISKIQYNHDVGQEILERYSRIIESIAFTVLSRMEDVLRADDDSRKPIFPYANSGKFPSSKADQMLRLDSSKTLKSKRFLDFMGWSNDQSSEEKKKGR